MFEAFGLDIKLIIAQIINFGLFLILFKVLLSKPFLKILREEKEKTESFDVREKDMTIKEEALATAQADMKKELSKERESILAETKKIAAEEHARIIDEAKKGAEKMMVEVREQIESQKKDFDTQITKISIDTSVQMIRKALGNVLTPEVQDKLTDHIIKNAKVTS